jgi:PQQ-dependent catabolism-associated CXXCW motif protein
MMRIVTVVAAMLAAMTSPVLAQDSFGEAMRQQQQPPQGSPPQQGMPPQQGYPPPQGYPPQPGGMPPQQGYPPAGSGTAGGADLDRLMQMERQDYGVAPPATLHAGPMHGQTPTSIPGGQIITTKGLVSLMQGGQAPFFVFDVLGGPAMLPNAMPAAWTAQPGSFDDQTQQQLGGILQQGTQGRKDVALIFYCQSTMCWMSYNAALRTIKLGYSNVLWYRGGIEAWQMAGLPTQPAPQGDPQGGYGGQPPQDGYGGQAPQGGYQARPDSQY